MSFAFVFPGQGSQSVGMMAAYGDAAVVRATFDALNNCTTASEIAAKRGKTVEELFV